MKKVKIEVWSDFVCPWCWIAKRRLEKAIAAQSVGVEIQVVNKAYRIAKGILPMDFAQALTQKFGNEASGRQMMNAVAHNGALEGLTYNFPTMRFGDTTDAHALVKSLRSESEKQLLIEKLMEASITNGQDIFDRAVLKDIAIKAGISRDVVETCNFVADDVARDERTANQIASGVPLFVFNSNFYVSGAQPVEKFMEALDRAVDSAPETIEGEQGVTCGSGGCTF
ncbi:disulfide bond formation protein DsbA [Paraburkholderia ginsengiterrae]|uniref:Disulfide bond formation protein DsbA n=1 Tax=Paraburkholderia ginsengiterrae TaxID=1462993 RepID=A0A1A9N4C4_9BURK|nr:DsbA family oxidoreductase [Paraburkholderia ginsengiterrae]OAJ55996.1 disulfide bond formation protein DsbA [Paraburkholderia ginsengiterrae]OAJ58547.1 disulfide bond formation protein DsbA [Paraburkholderia ginsengiterrae]